MTEVTFSEMLEMREKLNAALTDRIGEKPCVGFCIEVGAYSDTVAFCGAYPHNIEFSERIDSGPHQNPRQAFDAALSLISKIPGYDAEKAKKIAVLRAKIEQLEKSQ